MLFTLFKAILLQPQLMAQHAQNYAELVSSEAHANARHWFVTLLAWISCIVCVGLFLAFVGFAVMIGCLQERFHWVLVVIPVVPLVFALIAAWVGMQKNNRASLRLILNQLSADIAVLSGTTPQNNHEQ